VRVLAGRWKGRLLDAPASARPTSGRARQALFNILGERVRGARVLDLYAGSGAVGIEAVSRGAASARLVESDMAPLARTLSRIGPEPGEIVVEPGPVSRAIEALAASGERFDIVFADPPYRMSPEADGLDRAGDVLAPGGSFILQQDAGSAERRLPGLAPAGRREYGRNVFLFFGML
jgi:16S rRNA (guanine966-N2)-methyltransferase